MVNKVIDKMKAGIGRREHSSGNLSSLEDEHVEKDSPRLIFDSVSLESEPDVIQHQNSSMVFLKDKLGRSEPAESNPTLGKSEPAESKPTNFNN